MLVNKKGSIDPSHYDIILAESLVNEKGDFYDLTFKQALDEILKDEQLLDCNYTVHLTKTSKRLDSFIGWTNSKVIFMNAGPFTHDALLDYVWRNPPTIDRFTT